MKIYSFKTVGSSKPRLFQNEKKAYETACKHILDKYPTIDNLIEYMLELEDTHVIYALTGMSLDELKGHGLSAKRTFKKEYLVICNEYERTIDKIKHLCDIAFTEDFVKVYKMQSNLFKCCQDFFDKVEENNNRFHIESDLFVKIEECKVE